jgi:putative Mn2+ efflux pump MntP
VTGALKIVLVALSLALDVFAVSVGVGVRGVPRAQKIRIGLSFAAAEVIMNLIGAGLGAVAGKLIGGVAAYFGYGVLILLGIYMMIESRKDLNEGGLDLSKGWGLFLASLSISLDSLGIGFTILYIGVPIEISLVVIAIVSILATTLGLSLGKALGARAEGRAAFFGGVILTLTGALFATLQALEHH